MTSLSLIAAFAVVVLSGANAAAAEFPIFELRGFPITPHQVAVMGGTDIQEQAPTPALTFRGMPASPHQIAVLTPRPSVIAKGTDAKLTAVGLSGE